MIFWDPSDSWGAGAGLSEFNADEKQFIKDSLKDFYDHSAIAQNWLNQLAASGSTGLRIGKSTHIDTTDFNYIRYNQNTELWMINASGAIVKSRPEYQLLHEVLHLVMHRGDNQSPDVLVQNQPNYDFWGPIVFEERRIAPQMNDLDQMPSAYRMRLSESDAANELGWNLGDNYSNGQSITFSRRGNEEDNFLTMEPRDQNAGPSDDLIIGMGGKDEIHGARGNDYLYGDFTTAALGGDDDTLYGGDGDDRMYGGPGDDVFYGGKGDDTISGGLASGPGGTSDGTDRADYSDVTASSIFIAFASDGDTSLTVSDGQFGIDTLRSIERILGTSKDDSFTFTGEGTNAKVDMTDLVDGYALTSQNGVEVRVKSIEVFVGGDNLTTFIGNGDVGRNVIFIAGSGGGDFTLKSGNRAYGYDDVVDTFRVTTTVPAEFAAYTDAQKIEYLRNNRVFIGNFGEEDQLYVDGVLFNGNRVTSQIAPTLPVEPNNDSHTTSVWLTGDSSYNTAYPHAHHEVRDVNDSGYVFGSNETYRNVSYQVVDDGDEETVLGLISFSARTGHGHALSPDTFELDDLAPENGMLSIVIEDFAEGDGGISFTHDSLSSLLDAEALVGNLVIDTPDVTDPMRLPVALDCDVIDGTADGWVYGGGATVDSDSEHFNFGAEVMLGAGGVAAYVLGAEELVGTEGDDQIAGGVGDDSIYGLGGADTLAGGTGSDFLDGGEGDDQLAGGEGDDMLKGGAGRDAMAGGIGDDSYDVDNVDDVVTEYADEGNDTIVTAFASFSLQDDVANIENLFFNGFGNFIGAGNDADNHMSGGAGDDSLSGGAGNDKFDAFAGADAIDGGDGSDTLVLEGGRYRYGFARDGAGVITVTDFEDPREIVLTSVEAVYFSGIDQTYGLDDLFGYYGTEGDDVITASDVDNLIYGLGGSDTLFGANGNDLLDGGVGADLMTGGEGDDSYVVDDAGDNVVEATDEGYDAVESSISYTLGDNQEELALTGAAAIDGTGNALDNYLTGNDAANLLDGLGGNDELDGGLGDDTYRYAAGGGDDILFDAGGIDRVEFGAGILPGEIVVSPGEGDSYVLTFTNRPGSLTLWGAALEDYAIEAIYFASTGQTLTLADLTGIYGTSGDDNLTGTAADDRIYGLAGSDLLQGLAGNDMLDGGAGADTMQGGTGNDVYLVDQSGDVVTEAYNAGSDEVRTALASYTLGANVERLIGLAATGQNLTGNSLANILTGGAGADVLNGGSGSDTAAWSWSEAGVTVDLQSNILSGDAAGDTLISIENLTGGSGADTLSGTSAANVLDGGGGADLLTGRGGNDVYYVDNAGDVVVELAGQGSDEIRTTLAALTLAGNVETLRYVGTGDFDGTGNGLGNILYGGVGNDTLHGGAGVDTLIGGDGADALYGGEDGDVLEGRAGADYMEGGAGSDVYTVDNAGDVVHENADEGIEQVYSTLAAYTLTANVENLQGNANMGQHLVGNDLANVILGGYDQDTIEGGSGNDELRGQYGNDVLIGGDGDDLLVGADGIDALTGGAGADTFRYGGWDSGTLGSADRITDFVAGEDRIDLAGIDAGFWTPGQQHFAFIGSAAFSNTAGELRYASDGIDTYVQADWDGDGAADIEIVLTGQIVLTAAEFIL